MKEQLTPKEEEALEQVIRVKESAEFQKARNYYEQIPVPEELGELVNETIRKQSKARILQKKRRERKRAVMIAARSFSALAAALVLFMIPLNTNEAFAEQMQGVPVFGRLAKVLTIRSYSYTENGANVQVEMPEISYVNPTVDRASTTGSDDENSSDMMRSRSVDDLADTGNGSDHMPQMAGESVEEIAPDIVDDMGTGETLYDDQVDVSQNFTDEVNEQIQTIVAEFEEEAKERFEDYREDFFATGGTEEEWGDRTADIIVDYEVTYQEGSVISLTLVTEESWVAFYGTNYYYNLDMEESRYLTLADLLGEDWIELCNESIRTQIEERLAEDDSLTYWGYGDFVDDPDGFTTVDENTNFYINENGNPVVCFGKYEIAPGYMGVQEFEIIPHTEN